MGSKKELNIADAVSGYLFAEPNANVYAILDGASVESLVDMLYDFEPEFECLYRGDLVPDVAEVAPYLAKLDRKSAFTDWLLSQGWGKHWGIFAVSKGDLSAMRRHLRRFLTVHDADGKPMLFRYYDPRVLRAFLPTCDVAQLEEMFGPVLVYIVEGQNQAELQRYQFAGGVLVEHVKRVAE